MMLSVVVFTYTRRELLKKCITSLRHNSSIDEILIFNDDETVPLCKEDLASVCNDFPQLRVFNPQDFGLQGRLFRKHFYMNKSADLVEQDNILFTDDDGVFAEGAIDMHARALETYHFCAGAIIRDRWFNRISKTILQGTNYSFRRDFFDAIGRYDEMFAKSSGGGDPEFWYRIYKYVKKHETPVAFMPKAVQHVIADSKRDKRKQTMNPREYIATKHGLSFHGPLYTWFPEIRDKKRWMSVIYE